MKTFSLSLLILCSFYILGCGKDVAYEGEPRIALSGRVTIDGQSIDGGSISFIPQSPSLRVAGGPIVNGMYSVPEEKGANSGQYRVEIRWPKPNGKKYRDPDTGEAKDAVSESVPAKFNTQSTLTATISPDQPTLDFDLKSK